MKKIIIANWKANLSPKEAAALASKYAQLKFPNSISAVVCPDFSALHFYKKGKITLGAQDCSQFLPGSHTGEVSAQNLKKIGVQYVILGHSERRLNGEKNEVIKEKVLRASLEKITPILCIGENASEKKAGKTLLVLSKQLSDVLNNLPEKLLAREILIAYEPVWAIGSGHPLAAEEAAKICAAIKSKGVALGVKKIKVLYGGSVNEKNFATYLAHEEITGFLLGGASLNIKVFSKILQGS